MISYIRRALSTSTHLHRRNAMQAGHGNSDKPVCPSPFAQPFMPGVTILLGFCLPHCCLRSLPRLSCSLHTSLLCCCNVCFSLLTVAVPSSGQGAEMQPLGKQHRVHSCIQQKGIFFPQLPFTGLLKAAPRPPGVNRS